MIAGWCIAMQDYIMIPLSYRLDDPLLMMSAHDPQFDGAPPSSKARTSMFSHAGDPKNPVPLHACNCDKENGPTGISAKSCPSPDMTYQRPLARQAAGLLGGFGRTPWKSGTGIAEYLASEAVVQRKVQAR